MALKATRLILKVNFAAYGQTNLTDRSSFLEKPTTLKTFLSIDLESRLQEMRENNSQLDNKIKEITENRHQLVNQRKTLG